MSKTATYTQSSTYQQTPTFLIGLFDNGDERRYKLYVRIPVTYYAQTGLADLYVGKNNVSGSSDARLVSMTSIKMISITKVI